MNSAPPPLTGPRDLDKIARITRDILTAGNELHGDYYFLGNVEIRMLATRSARFSDHALRLRMLNGLYPLRRNDPAYDPRGPQAFAVHAREIWSRGAALIQHAMHDEQALRTSLLKRLSSGIPRFEIPG